MRPLAAARMIHQVRVLTFLFLAGFTAGHAETKVSPLFSDHAVLQQGLADPVWGWDAPGTHITVSFAGQTKETNADANSRWRVVLDPMPAQATAQTLVIQGASRHEVHDVLVGEVWLCSGQSNMGFALSRTDNAPLEAATSHLPGLRLLSVTNATSQWPQATFEGTWAPCTPESSLEFSAIGLFFGRYLHEILQTPVGIISNACGGSSIEAWMDRTSIEGRSEFPDTIASLHKMEARASQPQFLERFAKQTEEYRRDMAAFRAALESHTIPQPSQPRRPHDPRDFLGGPLRAGNLYNGALHPLAGYGIKGVLWYQGESNANQAAEYEGLFTTLIPQWRALWHEGDFPFYWVQLPNYGQRTSDPPVDDSWARAREGQSKALRLPHTAQAVAIDLGVGDDLHPHNKMDVAARLARIALANDYGKTAIPSQSPQFHSVEFAKERAIVTFDHPGSGLCVRYNDDLRGFAIAGSDRVWHWAHAQIQEPNQVIIWNEKTPHPAFVRYAWGDNPECNLYTNDGLPATPFRTDTFAEITPAATPVAKH